MNKIIKDFVDVLKDPEHKIQDRIYTPAKDLLRKGNCFCATGVLCDLLVQEYPIRYEWKKHSPVYLYGEDEKRNDVYNFVDNIKKYQSSIRIPEYIFDELGIHIRIYRDREIGSLLDKYVPQTKLEIFYFGEQISVINDAGMPWSEISDVIEHALILGENESG